MKQPAPASSSKTLTLSTIYPMIETLFVGCIDEDIPEEEIRKAFEEYGTIKDVRMIQKRSCAIIDYSNRSAAEEAVKSLWGTFTINGCQLRVECIGIFIFQMNYQTLTFTLIFISVASRIALAVEEIRARMESEGEVLVDQRLLRAVATAPVFRIFVAMC
jgi:hypothetical protein